ncbi:hypothetical protein BH09CHL1_BH09CHL1_13580 [soil metagenome]
MASRSHRSEVARKTGAHKGLPYGCRVNARAPSAQTTRPDCKHHPAAARYHYLTNDGRFGPDRTEFQPSLLMVMPVPVSNDCGSDQYE